MGTVRFPRPFFNIYYSMCVCFRIFFLYFASCALFNQLFSISFVIVVLIRNTMQAVRQRIETKGICQSACNQNEKKNIFEKQNSHQHFHGFVYLFLIFYFCTLFSSPSRLLFYVFFFFENDRLREIKLKKKMRYISRKQYVEKGERKKKPNNSEESNSLRTLFNVASARA